MTLSRAMLVLSVACAGGCAGASDPSAEAPSDSPRAERIELAHDHPAGLSGLTIDGDGTLWAVPELERVILEIRDRRVARVVPLDGDLRGLDVEAVTWIAGGRFAIGTEAHDPSREGDRIFVIEVGARARIVEEILLPYDAIGAVPDRGDGLEALCHTGGELVAVVEHVVEADGMRFAAGGRRALAADASWRPFRVRLTTDIGKVSDVSCAPGVGGVEVHAIERGIDEERWVARVIRFTLPPDSDGAVLDADVVYDLSDWLTDHPNPEGLAFDAAGDLWLVFDNFYGVRTGPNELLRVPASRLRSRHRSRAPARRAGRADRRASAPPPPRAGRR